MKTRPSALLGLVLAACSPAAPRDVAATDASGDTAVRDVARAADVVATDATDVVVVDAPTDGARDDARSGPLSGDDVWSPLTALTVVDPMDHGALCDGTHDDLAALGATIAALPAQGGIVYLPPGRTCRKTNVLTVSRAHVKFWAPNRQATLYGETQGMEGRQATLCANVAGCGFFGVRFTSDANHRWSAPADNQISVDHGSDAEVVGCEINGSAAVGVFLFGTQREYVEGNYIHHTWADHIHHTAGARTSYVWDNWIFNEAPSLGDDGVACVTYGTTSPRCGAMEWWHNTILQTAWGRGYAVIGGDTIAIHDNWGIRVAGAGVIVASEAGGTDSATSDHVTVTNNHLDGCAWVVGHPGMLVSGENPAAAPLSDLTFTNNVVVATATGQAYRAEGMYTRVTNAGLSTAASDLPAPMPTVSDVVLRDTSVLATRDTSFVDAGHAPGLHRIHVRRAPSGTGFQQRFEYVVSGSPTAIAAFVAARTSAGDYVSETRTVGSQGYALVLSAQPVAVPAGLAGVSFAALRTGDLDGSLSWLWARINARSY